jgi:hypothetical protein
MTPERRPAGIALERWSHGRAKVRFCLASAVAEWLPQRRDSHYLDQTVRQLGPAAF